MVVFGEDRDGGGIVRNKKRCREYKGIFVPYDKNSFNFKFL